MKHFFTAGSRSGFRTWLLLLLVASFLALSPMSAAEDGKSWVGKKVMTKKGGIKIGYTDKNGEIQYLATLTNLIYKVEREQGDFIKVRHQGVAVWFDKADAVLMENAIHYFTARIRRDEKDAYAYALRGFAWKEKGELDIALKDYDEAIRLDPKEARTFNNRGNAYNAKKDYDRAIRDYDEAIRLDPKYVNAFNNRGVAYRAKKDYDRAIRDYNEAIRLDPMFASAFNNRAWLLATCPDAKYRDGKRAVEAARKACGLTDWKEANYIDTLAAAYAEAGNFEEAVKWQKKLLADKEWTKKNGEDARKRLKLYREEKPYRDVE
jgi:tetratricopeptide (TPR) repeat protein